MRQHFVAPFSLAAWSLAALIWVPIAMAESPLPLVLSEDFEKGAERWKPFDSAQWQVKKTDSGQVYSQFVKKSTYKPPHRSPTNISLLQGTTVGDFDLTVKVHSTHPDYGHRDACLVFGYQDPAHFYYVHLGKQADDHANQIFIVNNEARKKISLTSTTGTNWQERWHTVKVSRRIENGAIEVFFDDLTKPVMTASDKNFVWGQIGVGTFDDTADFDNLELRGVSVQPAKK